MAPFPFFKLPLLAQKKVIRQIPYQDLIELSMMSEKFKKVMELAKVQIDSVEFNFEGKNVGMELRHELTYMKIYVAFSSNEILKKRKIDGLLVPLIYRDWSSSETIIALKSEEDTDESKLKLFEKITRHLLSILKVKIFKLFFRNIGLIDFFLWKYDLRFQRIYFTHHYKNDIPITLDEMKFLLEEAPTDALRLDVELVNNPHFNYQFQPKRPLKFRKLCIDNANWVDFDTLSNVECEEIEISGSRYTDTNVNQVLKKWISGNNEKLEELCIPRCEMLDEHIFQGISATPSVFSKEELRDRTLIADTSAIRDILRTHDSRLATVIVSGYAVKLLVWNEKNLKAIGKL